MGFNILMPKRSLYLAARSVETTRMRLRWDKQWTHAGKATSMGLGRYRIQG